LKFKTR